MGNREALLEAAVECLREIGYGSATARDVAGRAGVSLGAIQYHFGSTEGLLNEAIAEGARRWIAEFQLSLAQRVAAHPGAGIDGLLAACDDIYVVFSEERHGQAAFIEALAHALRSPQTREQLAQHYVEFRAAARVLLQTAGIETTPGMDSKVSILIALIDGLALQWLLDPNAEVDLGALRAVIFGVLTSGDMLPVKR